MRTASFTIAALLLLCCFYLGVQLEKNTGQVDQLQSVNLTQQGQIEILTEKIEDLKRKIRFKEVLEIENTSYSQAEVYSIVSAIMEAERTHNLDPELILAVIMAESTLDKNAVSRRGAFGLMQLLPSTAKELAEELHLEYRGIRQLREPEFNIRLGSYYLRKLVEGYDDVTMALIAYNMGPGKLDQLRESEGQVPDDYSEMVRRCYKELTGRDSLPSS
jgi:soluble lytic murein transglycosylase-like protein